MSCFLYSTLIKVLKSKAQNIVKQTVCSTNLVHISNGAWAAGRCDRFAEHAAKPTLDWSKKSVADR